MRTTRWQLPAAGLLMQAALALATFGCATTPEEDTPPPDQGMGGNVPPTTTPPTTTPPTNDPTTPPTTTPPTVTAGAGGSSVTPPTVDPMTAGTGGTGVMMPINPDEMPVDPRGGCGIDTGFPGDDTCMLPPPEGEGFQIHVGPPDYANAGPFAQAPGLEDSKCVSFHTPNTEDIVYQGFVLSARPGTHHIINTMYIATTQVSDNTFEACLDFGTGQNASILDNLPGASKPYMPRKPVAPEDAGLGRKIPANAPAQADMHYFNFTESDVLREMWLNIYYLPAEKFTEEAQQIRGMGGLAWQGPFGIAPGTDQVYRYSCPIPASGRIVGLLGHYHAHGVRFSAFLTRAGGSPEKVFEMYDYNEPAEFSYNSTTTNPIFTTTEAGATSGRLEVTAGDTLDWECHIINDSAATLVYGNQVETGEMCNLWGASVLENNAKINCVLL